MRLTLKLDDFVKLLRRVLVRSGASLKATMHYFFSLRFMAGVQPTAKPFVVHPRPLGLPPGLSYDNVEGLIEALESPLHR